MFLLAPANTQLIQSAVPSCEHGWNREGHREHTSLVGKSLEFLRAFHRVGAVDANGWTVLVLMNADQSTAVLQNVVHRKRLESGDRPERVVPLTREYIQCLEKLVRERKFGFYQDAVEAILSDQPSHLGVILQSDGPPLAWLKKTSSRARSPVQPTILKFLREIR